MIMPKCDRVHCNLTDVSSYYTCIFLGMSSAALYKGNNCSHMTASDSADMAYIIMIIILLVFDKVFLSTDCL